MNTLTQIISDLDQVLVNLNLGSVEIQSLKLFLANSLYKNEALGCSAALESSPLTCVNLNSAIEHAAKRNYKVFRGKNPRITIVGLKPIKEFKVKKYDVFLDIQGYQLVYAQPYEFVDGQDDRIVEINLILTKEVVSSSVRVSNQYSMQLPGPCSEDFYLYEIVDGNEVEIQTKSRIVANASTSQVYQTTITDYGIELLSLDKFETATTIYSKVLPLIEDEDVNLEELMNSISSIPNFDTQNLPAVGDSSLLSLGYTSILANRFGIPVPFNIDSGMLFYGVTKQITTDATVREFEYLPTVNLPESNLDKIYLNSIINENTGDSVKSTDDLQEILIPLTAEYYSTISVDLDNNVLTLYYILKDPTNIPTAAWMKSIVNSIKQMFYNEDITISDTFVQATKKVIGTGCRLEYKALNSMETQIRSSIEEFCNGIIGGTFYPYEMLFYLQKKLNANLNYLAPGTTMTDQSWWNTPTVLSEDETPDLSQLLIVRK